MNGIESIGANPLVRYLLNKLASYRAFDCREFNDTEAALNEFGLWVLCRPVNYPADKILPCRISDECDCIAEIGPFDMMDEPNSVMCGIYAERDVTQQPWREAH